MITVLALFVAASVLNITVMWCYAVGTVVLGYIIAEGLADAAHTEGVNE